ncbi:MAG: glycosyl hydrolase, partial [Bacteroidales bacterium]|nr:glycosyl hydrolase [Bacteroidales bacterium]
MNAKVLLLGIALIMVNTFSGKADILPVIDFEDSNIDSVSVDTGENEVTFSCVDNPENTKLNKSGKALKIEITGNDVSEKGVILSFQKIRPLTDFYLHVKVYTPGTQFTVSAISLSSSRTYGDEPYNVAYQNQWVEMVYPLNRNVYIQGLKFLPKTAGTIYIDDITINSDPNVRSASIKDSEAMIVDARSSITVSEDTIIRHTAAMNRDYTLKGNGELHFTYSSSPLVKSTVALNSEDAWLFFDSIRPLNVFSLLNKITVNGNRASLNNNVRVEMYGEGTVVIPQGASFAALTVYNDLNRKGESKELIPETYYTSTQLGAFDNEISSFVLKKGYMATFAESSNGTGTSRVYIATDNDIVVNKMPVELDKSVSFIRVFPWRYTAKKGYCNGSADNHEKLKISWFYTWGPSSSLRSLNKDFTAMVTGKSDWFPYGDVNNQTGINHVLGYNEPDQTNQADMSMQEMINGWPSMMASGLRVGSPAYASIGNGLYTFIRECEHRNYRIDFVALHAYFGGWERSNWTSYFSDAYTNTRRPLWTTEWNNGANWTTEGGSKTEAEQKKDITYILDAMESTDYFERYSIYNWVEDWRRVIRDNDGSLTPAGEVYRDTKSKISFNKTYEYIQNPVIEKDQTFLIRNQRDGYLYQEGTTLKTSGSTSTTNLNSNYYWTVEYLNSINNKTGHYRIKNMGTGDYIAYSGNANSAGGYTIQSSLSKNNNLSLAHYQTIGATSNAPFSYYTISYYNTTVNGGTYTYNYQAMDSYADKVVGSYSDYRSN